MAKKNGTATGEAKKPKKSYAEILEARIAKEVEKHNAKQDKLNVGADQIKRLRECLAILKKN